MNDFENERRLARAIKYLIDMEEIDAATLLLSAEVEEKIDEEIWEGNFDSASIDVTVNFLLKLPIYGYKTLKDESNNYKQQIEQALNFSVSQENESYENERNPRFYTATISLALKFFEFSERDWREEAKVLLKRAPTYSNQAVDYWASGVILWENMRFRSSEEQMIAQELDRVGVLFVPNTKVRCGLKEKRQSIEPDFLVFAEGHLGVLEIDGNQHAGYAANDHDRDRAFAFSGVKTVQRYPAQRCRQDAKGVVKEFLLLLTQR